ncbi:malto-oligosyltrehalose synthase [Mucilaginibacter sp. Bleaf8]|uniref:malto-oligosyltrehalose synthase n=1 Tax=Mucilaginibacter sp. Bleaf8 TaxID=2834430 RepID=UPI001BCB31DE|nr:malto-oligosyltrehalose synthase [Mucilaginibacter sp. Bleaf8]MBS7563685.1 malto-oligosyltrehalose synthase [Mucilaginibacter sp. Bleaf8]
MNNPVATYRLQFHSAFTFNEFERIIGYLQKLGVSTVYASPVFEATPGSTHGYDGVNPHLINPEIGTEKQLKAISARLKENNIGWLQDIVPNHMGFHQNNPWLMDLLEKGKQSLYASFFDAAWTSPLFKDEPLMVPFLGNSLEEAINNNEIKVAYDAQQGLVLQYYDNIYPVNPNTYGTILQTETQVPEELQALITKLPGLNNVQETGKYAVQWTGWKQKLIKALKVDDTNNYLTQRLSAINADKVLLLQLANQQAYRLCSWQETDQSINFRRFFTVNSLICLNIQDKAVFDHFHQMIKNLVEAGVFQGLRIDHIDGLYDPAQYLERLRELAGEDTYIVAEKILESGEELATQWPLQGSSGYDYLALVNNLLTNQSAEKKLTRFYEELVNDEQPVQEQIWKKKAYILYEHMGGELENLYQLLNKLNLIDKKIGAGLQPEDIKKAIGEVLIHCPVYRYYGNQLPLPKDEYEAVKEIFNLAKTNTDGLKAALNLLEVIILEKPKLGNEDYNQRALQFYQRLMQFSGPLMAKGVEDTLMYTYNRFIAHNEVGDAPDAFGMSAKKFHKLMLERQKQWPLAINGTSTHDTKRGEDVRARLNVLSDVPKLWLRTVKQWQKLNANLKQNNAPSANDEYFIYQTIAGAYPMPGQPDDDFTNRLQEYLTKAMREAKVNSNWTEPNEEYEQATLNFAASILDTKSEFWKSFQNFQLKIADFGIVNSLAQVLLKFTCPGVPDVYQGCELYDLSLVDPDNRRPVDYNLRSRLLDEFDTHANSPELLQQLWQNRFDGQIKLWLTNQLFHIRKKDANLFAQGSYIPLQVKGAYKDYVMAYARRYEQTWYVAIVPLYPGELSREQDKQIHNLKWKNTRIILPAEAPTEWQNLLIDTNGKVEEGAIKLKDVLSSLPLGLLKLEQTNSNRGAGILMHITSLPSGFGVGDLGPGAKTFADFLSRCGQKYWQLLPLNPTGAEQNYSPYSSISSMAGNTLLISPMLLVKEGLLDEDDVNDYYIRPTEKVDYAEAKKIKDALFEQAYVNCCNGSFTTLNNQFKLFCEQEAYWLDDFALYTAIKRHHESKPWYEWPREFKQRKPAVLKRFAEKHSNEINKAKWLQFIFDKQWKSLKEYCHTQNIQLFGDLPFYVSYDSVDVWANPDSFALDAEGNMVGVAGVPPDYFNENGQLWGMPVYQWGVMKANGYRWWIGRLRKNMEMFDLLRLDHFRAFSAYWEVPAGEDTAKNGKWKPGPGSTFFKAVQDALGDLPFVAEDLGEIDEPVFQLRDEFGLPGMKILQFAFGDEIAASLYIPHNYQENYLVYTGTHDNNTTLGWFHQDANKAIRKQIEQYTGVSVKASNIHEVLGRVAYASTAKLAILPIQDVIGLDESARMNNPSSAEGNWGWRLLSEDLTQDIEERLLEWVRIYNRA